MSGRRLRVQLGQERLTPQPVAHVEVDDASVFTSGRTEAPAVLRGRDAELATIGQQLRDAKAGRGSVVLVEGRAGFGKSRLLDEARTSAEAAGFSVGLASAVEGDDQVSTAPLMAALYDGPNPVLDRGSFAEVSSLSDRQSWSIHRLEVLLEQATRSAPVMVCVDDAQWADRGTAAALRILPQRLSDLPIVWVVAFRSSAASPALTDLFTHLKGCGAETLSLEPLSDAAIEQLVADIVQAEPTTELMQFARRAGGSPVLLVELLRGLVDEGLVRVSAGRAELAEVRVPQRVCDIASAKLARLSALARRTVAVASMLGRTVSFDHVAAMLDVAPASLLGPVEELLLADVLVDTGRSLGFHNDLIRQAVIDTVPTSVRHALHRQAIDVLLEAGVSPLEPAAHFATSAQAGDRAAISTLIAASRALGPSDPEAAAELSRRALDLTAAGDELRAPLVAEMALHLHAAGRATAGKAVVDTALRERLAPEHEAELRLSVARMSDLPPEVRVEAGHIAVALPGVPTALRARHLSELVVNVLASGRPEVAKEWLQQAETAVASSGDRSAAQSLHVAKARLAYTEGAFQSAMQHFDASVVGVGNAVQTTVQLTDLSRAELLIAVDQFDAAHQLAADGVAAARRDGQVSAARSWERLLGRYLLETGRIADASGMLDGVLAAGHDDALVTIGDAAALVARVRIAIHTGHGRQARALLRLAEGGLEHGGPELRRHSAWALALHAMAAGDAASARAAPRRLGRGLRRLGASAAHDRRR